MEYNIDNIEDFKIILNIKLKEFELFIKKEVYRSSLINNSNREYLEYYNVKRLDVINKFTNDSFISRFNFGDVITLEDEDLNQMCLLPFLIDKQIKLYKGLSVSNDDQIYSELLEREQTTLKDYFNRRLNDFDLSLKLSYYNMRLIEFGFSNNGTEKYNTNYLYLFSEWGWELFEYLNREFNYINAPTTKFTILYYFLFNKGYIKGSKTSYQIFIRENYKSELNNNKFSRFAFDSYVYDKRYLNNEQQLSLLYKQFKSTHNY